MKDLEIVDLSGIAAQMGHKPDTAEAAKLALAFTKVLRKWLTRAQMDEVVLRNETSLYDDCCATGDFCDSNMAMEEAFQKAFSRDPEVVEPDGANHEADCQLWNAGWDIAKRMNFDVELLNAYAETF